VYIFSDDPTPLLAVVVAALVEPDFLEEIWPKH
jgi:hypothetical protein